MSPPRPASGDTIYIIHAYGSVTNSMSMLARQHSQPKRPGDLDLRPSDLESGVPVACDVGYLCANFSLPKSLSVLDLGPMYATDKQTDVRQTDVRRVSSLNAPPGREHKIFTVYFCLEALSFSRRVTFGRFIIFPIG